MTSRPATKLEIAWFDYDCACTALDRTKARREVEAAIAAPYVEALRLVYPVPHYGEPDGLSNCPRNPFAAPATDDEVDAAHRDQPCDCGADETNARVRALVERPEDGEEAGG